MGINRVGAKIRMRRQGEENKMGRETEKSGLRKTYVNVKRGVRLQTLAVI